MFAAKLPVLNLLSGRKSIFVAQIQVKLGKADGDIALACEISPKSPSRYTGLAKGAPKSRKFLLFGRVAPQGRTPRPISTSGGIFLRPTTLHKCYTSDVIRFWWRKR